MKFLTWKNSRNWKAFIKENWERLVTLCAWIEKHPILAPLLKLVLKILIRVLDD